MRIGQCVGSTYRSVDSGYSEQKLKQFADLRDESKIPLLDWLGDFRKLLNENGIDDNTIWEAIKEHYKEYEKGSENEADYIHWFTNTEERNEYMDKPKGLYEQISGMHYVAVEVYSGCYKAYDKSSQRMIDFRVPRKDQWDDLLKTLVEMKYPFVDFDSDKFGSVWWFDSSGADITETFVGYRKTNRDDPEVEINLWDLLIGNMENILKSSAEKEIKEFWKTEHKDKTDKELKELTKNYCEPQTPKQFRAEYEKDIKQIKTKYKAPHLLKFLEKVRANKDNPIIKRVKKIQPKPTKISLSKSNLVDLCTKGETKLSKTLELDFIGVSYIDEKDRKTLKKILSKAYWKGGN